MNVMKVYDCFTFFNELDLLEIRLNELNDVVDYFVLVESKRSFQNKPKECHYLNNKDRFEKFNHKIIQHFNFLLAFRDKLSFVFLNLSPN
jgi:beta-1,4-mannosyl-glycoprotein beta-1,4-N-acetylglucosaminyltransferase